MCQLGKTSKPIIFQSCLYCMFPVIFFHVRINPMGVEEFDLLDEESFNLVESISF